MRCYPHIHSVEPYCSVLYKGSKKDEELRETKNVGVHVLFAIKLAKIDYFGWINPDTRSFHVVDLYFKQRSNCAVGGRLCHVWGT